MILQRHRVYLSILLALAVIPASLLWAAKSGGKTDTHADGSAPSGDLVAITEKDSEWLKKAKAVYPVTDCIVSGEKLPTAPDEMFDFIYRREGEVDRLVSFCCEGCSKDFLLDAATFMKKLAEASAARK